VYIYFLADLMLCLWCLFRILAAAAPDDELVVLSRVRVGKEPVTAVAFSSRGSLLAAYSPKERQLWLIKVGDQGRAQVLGFVAVPSAGKSLESMF
jgi:hypothetical protein